MCILCVIQKWSRRVATMLPWLVLPLIGLWALSQLLPPAFRFEITSPRLACVFILLVTLFWYEVLMPRLSLWRVRRNAMLKEKKRSQAIELQKLRKKATKKCRNCLCAYRDQNPGGSRFMCSYCGHNSKRPILDLPIPPGMVIGNTGILKDLVGKGGKLWGDTVWTENGLMCGQDWAENGHMVGGSFVGKTIKSRTGFFASNVEHCTVTFACKLLASFFFGIRWLWRKIFKIGSPGEDDDSDTENMLAKRGENGGEFHESKSDKARRKAEEKRQARLEKELLEEEERIQREEVARLVEERRKLRDEKTEVENNRGEEAASVIEKDIKKKAEKKRNDRRKDKDKGSSKSYLDLEELEKRVGKESERKRESEKKTDYDPQGRVRVDCTDFGNGSKSVATNNYSGTRYLESMKGKFLSSSKAFGNGSFFGRGANNPVFDTKENRSGGFVEHAQSSAHKKELHQPTSRLAPSDPYLVAAPKKSWQQLFTRSPAAVPPASNSSIISRPSNNFRGEAHIMHLPTQSLPTQLCDNPINYGLPSSVTSSNYSYSSTSFGYPSLDDRNFPRLGETHESLPEESELFEDPCYVPDPVFLLGPVKESLNSFQLDLGPGFSRDTQLEKPRSLKNAVSCEISRPSPIESPLSRLKMADDGSSQFSNTSMTHDTQTKPSGGTQSSNEMGTYHMWNSSPLGQDGLGLVDILHPASHKIDGQTFASPVSVPTDHDPRLEKSFYPSSPVSESHIVFGPREEATRKEMMFENPRKSLTANPFQLPQGICWPNSMKDCQAKSSEEEAVSSSAVKPHNGGLYSLWSYE